MSTLFFMSWPRVRLSAVWSAVSVHSAARLPPPLAQRNTSLGGCGAGKFLPPVLQHHEGSSPVALNVRTVIKGFKRFNGIFGRRRLVVKAKGFITFREIVFADEVVEYEKDYQRGRGRPAPNQYENAPTIITKMVRKIMKLAAAGS